MGIISGILLYVLISYSLTSISLYLDARYEITDFRSEEVDFLFASLMGPLVALCVFFHAIAKIKININFNFHNKIMELGEKHGKQDKDPTYQLEKYLLDKK
jgi:hypothetical protein